MNIRSSYLPMAPYGSSVIKNLPANAEDWGAVPGLGRFPGGGHGNPLRYSWLENPHRPKNLAGYSPWGCKRVRHNLVTKHHVWIDTRADSEGESLNCARVAIWITFMGHSSGPPLANQFHLPGSKSILVYIWILPCVHAHLLAKMDSTERAYG